jgi:hypothetical protein
MKQLSALLLYSSVIGVTVACASVPGLVTRQEATFAEESALALVSAGKRFPGTAYDNQDQLSGARGELRVDHPTQEADITFSLSADGLTPHADFIVYIDTNGTGGAAPYSFGPWITIGSFSTDDDGHGEFSYSAPPSSYRPGSHTWTIYINRSDHGATVLISDDFTLEIATGS